MNLKLIFLLFFVACFSFSFQTGNPKVVIKFSEKQNQVRVDNLGNIYVIHHHEIVKYNSLGILQKKFSVKRYGNIDFVDVSNPLKILVYYKDFQQILFLDDLLTPSSDIISIETLGYEQASLICSSTNNSFWLYDKQNNALLRFDHDLKTVVKTGNLKQLLDINITPSYMKEHANYLYLNCPKEGILVFDIYGTFYKTIPIKNLKEFDLINEHVFYYQNNSLKEYQPQTFNTIEKKYEDTLVKQVYWKNERFYKIYADSLVVD
jgi:hypothetical protein